MPGSGETSPNPVFCAMPTHPDHTSAAAGAARTSSGQDRTARPDPTVAGDPSAAAGALVLTGTGLRRSGSAAGEASMVTAAMPVTSPSVVASGWRSPVSAGAPRRPLHRGWRARRVDAAPASLPQSVCPA